MPGETLKLRIGASGSPKPTIRWERDGQPIMPGGRFDVKTIDRDSTLTVSQITPGDAGRYSVIAENEYGLESADISVLVLGKLKNHKPAHGEIGNFSQIYSFDTYIKI